MPTFKITHTVDDQFIGDILTTALEGGIGYWATCTEIERANPANDRVFDQVLSPLTVYSAKVVDREWFEFTQTSTPLEIQEARQDGDGPDFDEKEINHDTVVAGIKALLTGKVKIRADLLDQVTTSIATEDCDIDADAADCIVQAGLFGEVIYG